MLYAGSGYHVFSETGLSYQLADSQLKAIIKEWLDNRTVCLKQVSSSNRGCTPGELKLKFETDTGLYCFKGTMLGCILEAGGLVKQINGRFSYIKTNLKIDKMKGKKSRYYSIDSIEEREKVDYKKSYSAGKYYTTNFDCDIFKEHFGDGANTYSEMVDSWARLVDIGVKISEPRPTVVYFDVPDQYVAQIPSFIQPWFPLSASLRQR